MRLSTPSRLHGVRQSRHGRNHLVLRRRSADGRRAPGGYILESINAAYEPRFVKKAEIDLIHPIVWARVTPAMEAGLADHIWTVREIVQLLDRR